THKRTSRAADHKLLTSALRYVISSRPTTTYAPRTSLARGRPGASCPNTERTTPSRPAAQANELTGSVLTPSATPTRPITPQKIGAQPLAFIGRSDQTLCGRQREC